MNLLLMDKGTQDSRGAKSPKRDIDFRRMLAALSSNSGEEYQVVGPEKYILIKGAAIGSPERLGELSRYVYAIRDFGDRRGSEMLMSLLRGRRFRFKWRIP